MSFPCPDCLHEQSTVMDCRIKTDQVNIETFKRRRRRCNYCGIRFTTYEIMEADYVLAREIKLALKKTERRNNKVGK